MRDLRGLVLAVALLLAALPWSAAEANSCNGGYYPSVKIGGEVTTAKTYTLADLQAMTTSKLNVAFFSGSAGMQTYSFIGVPLLDLLNEAGVVTNPNQKNDILRKSLVVTSSDCYQVVVAMAELLPTFSGPTGHGRLCDGDALLPSKSKAWPVWSCRKTRVVAMPRTLLALWYVHLARAADEVAKLQPKPRTGLGSPGLSVADPMSLERANELCARASGGRCVRHSPSSHLRR